MKKYMIALTFYFLCNKDTLSFHFKKYIFHCAKTESKSPPLTLPQRSSQGIVPQGIVPQILGSLTALSLNYLSSFMDPKHTASAAQPAYKFGQCSQEKILS